MAESPSSNREDPEPQPGDLIEIPRGVYKHWAVYVGDGYVVHVTDVDGGRSGVNLFGSLLGLSSRAVVKKDLLSEVTVGCRYKVNNKHDETIEAWPAEEIVQRALASVGQEWNYNLLYENCKHFATDMRYKIARSGQNREGPEPHPGDLIEISRGVYKHWAVCVGDGYVVHVTDVDGGRSGVNLSGSPLGLRPRGVMKKDLLSEVTAGCRYKVNNKHDEEMGPRPAEEIVQRALARVGREWKYNFLYETCEHFATDMRYRIARSGQAEYSFHALLQILEVKIITAVLSTVQETERGDSQPTQARATVRRWDVPTHQCPPRTVSR